MTQSSFSTNRRAGLFTPLRMLAAGITKTIVTATATRTVYATQSQAVCTIQPSSSSCVTSCQDVECPWFLDLLQSILIPPAYAKSSSSPFDALDSFMKDLSDNLPGQSNKSQYNGFKYPAVDRIVAIGDVHGDVNAMRTALKSSGIIDSKDKWIGGKSVLVQVGDQLDRGDSERAIYDLLFRLQDSAPQSGGAVHILFGNHELMNARLDFRYVSKGGFTDFSKDGGVNTVKGMRVKPNFPSQVSREIRSLPSEMRARARSIAQGGPLAMELAERAKLSVMIGDNIFIHGGLNTKHLTYGGKSGKDAYKTMEQLNEDVKTFLLGKGKFPIQCRGGNSPQWLRDYSRGSVQNGSNECRMLADTLKMMNARRMIVGHTPQAQGINSACGGRVWRIDTGMSEAYGGVPEAIEINRRGGVRIFTPNGRIQGSSRYN